MMKNARALFTLLAAALFWAGTGFSAAAATETHQLGFRLGSSRLDTLYNNNAGVYARIREVVSQGNGTRISINSYSSPDGKTSRNLQLARQRAESVKESLLGMSASPDLIVINKTEEDWAGVKAYIERSNKEWKEEALTILADQKADRKALLKDLWVGEAWEDLMKNCFPALRRVVVQLIEVPQAQEDGAYNGETVHSTTLLFSNGSSQIRKKDFSNALALDQLKGMARSAAPELYIYVKSSPEGDEKGNERLGNRRGKAVEKLLQEYGYSGTIHVIYAGEDWEGLRKVVEASADVPDKDAIVNILTDQNMGRNARKKALQALSYGKTWLRLLDIEMSGLRSAVISDSPIQ